MKKNLFTKPLKGMTVILSAAMLFTSLPVMQVSADWYHDSEDETYFTDEESETAAKEVPAEKFSEEEDNVRKANAGITFGIPALVLMYDTDGGEIVGEYEVSFPENHDLIVLPRNVVKKGNEFLGWYENTVVSDEKVEIIPANATGLRSFTAKWKACTYSITYYLDGGRFTNGYKAPSEHTYGEKTVLPTSSSIMKANCRFVGWADVTEQSLSEETILTELDEEVVGNRILKAVWADASDEIVYVDENTEFCDAWTAAIKNNKLVITLVRDVRIASEYKLGSGSVTIDLNGHTITGTGKSNWWDDSDFIFRIENNGKLKIQDTSAEKNGCIWVSTDDTDYDEVIYVDDGGKLVLESGTLKGNTDEDCRIVVVEDGALFTMNGGAVSGNKYNGDGAGIYINEGSFSMNGGEISDNHGDMSNDYGGGIYYDGGSGTFLEIDGGKICNNSAYEGGGIYLDDGKAAFYRGTITNNQAYEGGGIYAAYTAENPCFGNACTVCENDAVHCGGGIYLGGALLWIEGIDCVGDYESYFYNNRNGNIVRASGWDDWEIIY